MLFRSVYLANDPYTDSSSANVVGHDGTTRLHWGVVDHYDSVRQILYVDTSDMWMDPFWITSDTLWPSATINTRFRTTGTFPSNSFIQVHRSSNNYNLTNLSGASSYNQQTGETLASPPYPTQVHVINGGVNNSTIVAYANTAENYNPIVNTLVPQFSVLTPPGTSIFFDYTGISNTFVTDSSNTNISTLSQDVSLRDYERIVASRSTANASYSDNKTMTIHAHFTTDNQYLSPLIDCVRTEAVAVRNLIDPISSTYEEFYNKGS